MTCQNPLLCVAVALALSSVTFPCPPGFTHSFLTPQLPMLGVPLLACAQISPMAGPLKLEQLLCLPMDPVPQPTTPWAPFPSGHCHPGHSEKQPTPSMSSQSKSPSVLAEAGFKKNGFGDSHIPASLCTNYVTLGKLENPSGPQSSYLYNGNRNTSHW